MEERPFVEAVLENAEAVVDAAIDNEILKSIPVVGTALKLLKGATNIRDRLFAAKLMKFLQSLESVSEDMKQNILDRVAESPEQAEEVGRTVLLLLDRLASLEKPEIIAKLFVAYSFKRISASDFQRLSHAIDAAVLDDLQALLSSHNTGKQNPTAKGFLQYLYPVGLARMLGGKEENIGKLYFEISPLGNKMITAYYEGCKLCGQKGAPWRQGEVRTIIV